MAIAHSTSKAVSGRNRRKQSVGRSRNSGTGPKGAPLKNSEAQSRTQNPRPIRIGAPLRAFLGSERDVLIRVQSLLVCVTAAMEVEHSATGPYYPDVVGLAADILRRRVVNMDELLLDGALPADLDQGCRGD